VVPFSDKTNHSIFCRQTLNRCHVCILSL